MTGKKKNKKQTYNPNWGGPRPNQTGRPSDGQRRHTKSFWVTDAEAEALQNFLDELRNGKPVPLDEE